MDKDLEDALQHAAPGLQLFMPEDQREPLEIEEDKPLHIIRFMCASGQKTREKATYVRAMLAATMPADAGKEFVEIPIHSNAGVAPGRLLAIGPDERAQFSISMKNCEITWLHYDNSKYQTKEYD